MRGVDSGAPFDRVFNFSFIVHKFVAVFNEVVRSSCCSAVAAYQTERRSVTAFVIIQTDQCQSLVNHCGHDYYRQIGGVTRSYTWIWVTTSSERYCSCAETPALRLFSPPPRAESP